MNKEALLQIIEDAAKTGTTSLNLESRQLRDLPPEIGRLTNLTSLDLAS